MDASSAFFAIIAVLNLLVSVLPIFKRKLAASFFIFSVTLPGFLIASFALQAFPHVKCEVPHAMSVYAISLGCLLFGGFIYWSLCIKQ
jgi:hypothetical protein